MDLDPRGSKDFLQLLEKLTQHEKLELMAAGTTTSETLSQLHITTDKLPQRCQDLLHKVSNLQHSLGVVNLDPLVISSRQSAELARKLEEDYKLLELRQMNKELDLQIQREKKAIEELKAELQRSKQSLANQNPSPENVGDHVRQVRQKLASYEEIYEKAMAKFSKLSVPEGVLPKSIDLLAQQLATLKEEEENLRQRAEDIELARKARETLNRLRK